MVEKIGGSVPGVSFGLADHLVSCWTIEAARSAVLERRGQQDPALRAAERARILARRVHAEGAQIRPEYANGHAQWIADLAGRPEQTGPLAWFFIQRLGVYVDLHTPEFLEESDRSRLLELSAIDAEEVNATIARDGLPTPPPFEFPSVEPVTPPGKTLARIGIIGDPHVGLEISDNILPAVVDDLNRAGVDFSVAIGDLTQNGLADLFFRANEMLEKLDAPWIVTVGNHDMWGYDTKEAKGLERFDAAFARKPYDVYEANGVRVIAVNSADPAASPFPPFDIITGGFSDEPNESVPGGTISDETSQWLAQFGPEGPTLIMLHHPPHPYAGFPPVTFGLDEDSTKTLVEAVKRTGAWGVICGHTHRSALYEIDGVPMLEVPSPKEWPFGYGIVEVTDEGWSFNLLPISDRSIYEEKSVRTNAVIRNYSRGPDEARAFVWKR